MQFHTSFSLKCVTWTVFTTGHPGGDWLKAHPNVWFLTQICLYRPGLDIQTANQPGKWNLWPGTTAITLPDDTLHIFEATWRALSLVFEDSCSCFLVCTVYVLPNLTVHVKKYEHIFSINRSTCASVVCLWTFSIWSTKLSTFEVPDEMSRSIDYYCYYSFSFTIYYYMSSSSIR